MKLAWQITSSRGRVRLYALRDAESNPVLINKVLTGKQRGKWMLWWPNAKRRAEGHKDFISVEFHPDPWKAVRRAERIFRDPPKHEHKHRNQQN